MFQISASEIFLSLLSSLLMVVFAGMILVWSWALWRLKSGLSILPEQPLVSGGRVTWGLGTVFLVLLLYVAVNFASQWGYLWATGRLPKRQPPVPMAIAGPNPIPKQPNAEAVPGPSLARSPASTAAESSADREILLQTEVMFMVSTIDSVLLIMIPLLVRLTSGARLRDLGISLNGWMQQAAFGIGATLFVAPMIYAVQFAVVQIWPPKAVNDHPLKKMLEEQFTGGVVYLAIISAVILAPLLEELIFRAVFQSWLSAMFPSRRRVPGRRSKTPPASPSAIPDGKVANGEWETDLEFDSTAHDFEPERQFPWGAIVMTSLFFAIVHMPQWPAPVAIFFLSLALGIVYQRTGSWIASSFMHATFNGLSTIALVASILAGQVVDAKKVLAPAAIERIGSIQSPR
jgi:membrane protease YdiL (CAAX protease family)